MEIESLLVFFHVLEIIFSFSFFHLELSIKTITYYFIIE